ncbi:right-handed parallel beta-helix repeat-containing protein [Salinibius halmophilus]|uniref:right-handed parallel beta-helix repeat-containing protein n=1 Tax=Salinibius halmophilus TaxID=1853216 RepID=UPI000E661F82|nr:right-handed parallel beta-helix repeat-containing protein [Salinibius halmophilus]
MKQGWLVIVVTLILLGCTDAPVSSPSATEPVTTNPALAPFIKVYPASAAAIINAGNNFSTGDIITPKLSAAPGFKFAALSSGESELGEVTLNSADPIIIHMAHDSQEVRIVATNTELRQAVNESVVSGNRIILLQPGNYDLPETVFVRETANNLTLRSLSTNYRDTAITGNAYNNMFLVRGDYFTLEGLTLGGTSHSERKFVRNHIVQLQGEKDADYLTLRDNRFIDSFEQMIKVSTSSDRTKSGDYGLVENNLFEFTDGKAPQWYTGGIDAHNANHWVVRGNTFRHIHINHLADTRLTEGAIHFWSNSRDTLIENNIIYNVDRGIMLGLTSSSGHNGAIVRNNMIMTNNDVGIYLASATNVDVYNNSIWLNSNYANAIEYRFDGSQNNLIVNNLTNAQVRSRNGGQATVINNVTNAQADWFVDWQSGDLHLAQQPESVIKRGQYVEGLNQDIDGQQRPIDGIDIGADQVQIN